MHYVGGAVTQELKIVPFVSKLLRPGSLLKCNTKIVDTNSMGWWYGIGLFGDKTQTITLAGSDAGWIDFGKAMKGFATQYRSFILNKIVTLLIFVLLITLIFILIQ